MLVHRYNPIKTTKTSFMGTMNMLGLAKRTKVNSDCVATDYTAGLCRLHSGVTNRRY